MDTETTFLLYIKNVSNTESEDTLSLLYGVKFPELRIKLEKKLIL